MFFVRLPNDDELLTLRLWEAGTLGITEGDGFIDAFFEDAETASKFGVPEAVVDVDWVAKTQEGFPPLLVGEKFFLAPPWRTEPVAGHPRRCRRRLRVRLPAVSRRWTVCPIRCRRPIRNRRGE